MYMPHALDTITKDIEADDTQLEQAAKIKYIARDYLSTYELSQILTPAIGYIDFHREFVEKEKRKKYKKLTKAFIQEWNSTRRYKHPSF